MTQSKPYTQFLFCKVWCPEQYNKKEQQQQNSYFQSSSVPEWTSPSLINFQQLPWVKIQRSYRNFYPWATWKKMRIFYTFSLCILIIQSLLDLKSILSRSLWNNWTSMYKEVIVIILVTITLCRLGVILQTVWCLAFVSKWSNSTSFASAFLCAFHQMHVSFLVPWISLHKINSMVY